MTYIEIFNVIRSGETVFMASPTVKDAFDDEKVLMIIDDTNRLIHLWKGQKSSVALKFIGARLSQQVRGSRGLLYKVIPNDQGDECDELKQILDEEPSQAPDQFKSQPDTVSEEEAATYGGPPSAIATPVGLPDDLKEKLLNEALPDGFDREGIIRGKDFYGIAKSVSKVLGKEIVKEEIQKTEIPEGVLFDTNYGIRMLIKDGKIDAVEILKRKEN
ncbi:MAG: hypothetical protein ACTSVY_07255 [Candidatus Helarchaeota archaeon]